MITFYYLQLSAGVSPDSFDFEEQRLAEAFRELPLMRRRILEMLFVEELTPSEIAAKLHCSVQHVYNQRSLAIKRLRERLIKERKK
jgi:sigma-70, region 4